MSQGLLAEEEAAEPPRIAKPQRAAAVEQNVEVIVDAGRRVVIDDEHAARHAEVNNCRAVIRADQQVLGAPPDRVDAPAAQPALDTARNGPAQAPVAHDDVRDARIDNPRLDAAAAGLDFG